MPESQAQPQTDAPQTRPPEDPRVRLAGERTLLAWIRTGLAMMGFGFVVARFGLFLREVAALAHKDTPAPQSAPTFSFWIGTFLIILGVVVNLLAALQYYQFLHRLDRGDPYQPAKWSLALLVAVLLAVLGIGMAAYLTVVGQ